MRERKVKAWVAISRGNATRGDAVSIGMDKKDFDGMLYMFCDIVPCTITYKPLKSKPKRKP